MSLLEGKRVLVTGGTGSLGKRLVDRLLTGELGRPERIVVFSRDEAKQHEMRLAYLNRETATDEIIYSDSSEGLVFQIGDVRDYDVVRSAVMRADVVFHAAALKQVPNCEYFPFEAVQTNVVGARNIARAVEEPGSAVGLVVGISTDKACKPINVMGMTKALQERIFVTANLRCAGTRFVAVRYGNVIASRGSVLPVFVAQAESGGPVTVTAPEMTRFFLSLDEAVDTVVAAANEAEAGEIYIPRVPAALVADIARAVIGDRDVEITFTGIRPGEKIHEILVSEEECHRTIRRGTYYVIQPMLPELRAPSAEPPALSGEYSSADVTLDVPALRELVETHVTRLHRKTEA
jgi:UDP-glucose 4-epimerase